MSKTADTVDPKLLKALQRVRPILEPLLELFGDVDDVFTEPEALSATNVYKTAGRTYRSWKRCRAALDPDFDPSRYEQEMKEAMKSPLGRSLPARRRGSSTRSTDQKSISEQKRKKIEKPEKSSASRSARRVASDDRASGGQSRTKSPTASGAASRSEKGNVSRSGSSSRGTARSRKGKG